MNRLYELFGDACGTAIIFGLLWLALTVTP